MKKPREYTTPELVLVSLVAWIVGITVAACVVASRGIG